MLGLNPGLAVAHWAHTAAGPHPFWGVPVAVLSPGTTSVVPWCPVCPLLLPSQSWARAPDLPVRAGSLAGPRFPQRQHAWRVAIILRLRRHSVSF